MGFTQRFRSGELTIVADPAASPRYSATFSSQKRKTLVRPREPEASCRWAVPAPPMSSPHCNPKPSCRRAVPAPPMRAVPAPPMTSPPGNPKSSCRWAVPAPPISPQCNPKFISLKMPTRSVDTTRSVDKKSIISPPSSPTMSLTECCSPRRRSPDRGPRLPRRMQDESMLAGSPSRDTVSLLTEALEMADMSDMCV
jgi:hypothetical protein